MSDNEQEARVYRNTLQDYWVDLLGGLLPGALVTVSLIAIFFPTLFLLANAASGNTDLNIGATLKSILITTKGTPSMLWFGIATISVSMIYIIGHIFYRKDPKKPNQISYLKIISCEARNKNIAIDDYLKYIAEDRESNHTLDEFKKYLQNEYGCTCKTDCEFPFPYFSMYLKHRGLNHLLPLVPWENDINIRTKNFINILKVRLRFHFPNKCGTIIRNEGHVRLASSTWYVGRVISIAAIVALLFIFASLVILYIHSNDLNEYKLLLSNYFSEFLVITIFIVLIGVLGQLVRSHIETFLHYQRQREVVHVLETAFTAFDENKSILCPPFCLEKK